MTLPAHTLGAIARAVERAGGDMDDALDLAAQWDRLLADRHGRLDRLRTDNRRKRQWNGAGEERAVALRGADT